MRRFILLLAIVWLTCGPLVAQPSAVEDRPPVALHQTPILTPRETAGSGLAPEVKLRVVVDERGRPAQVDVLEIVPTSSYDELFRQTVVDTVESWRWAPAIVDGQPAPKTLEWTLQFLAIDKQSSSAVSDHALGTLLGSGDPEIGRARMLALPLEVRKQLLVSQVSTAERLLVAARRRKAESPHFVVVSDAEDTNTAEVVARNLESIYNLLGSVFQRHIEPQPESLKIVAYVFGQRSSYEALTRQLGSGELSAGVYLSTGLLAFHVEVASTDQLMSTMLHEASHAYVDRYLVRTDRPLPRWLGEGFANYLGNSEIKKGQLQLGATLKSKYVLSPSYQGAFQLKTGSGWDVEAVKKSIRSGERLTLDQLFDADLALFSGERCWLYYPTAWSFVHFLRHGAPEWVEREFPMFMLYVAEGYPAPEALEAVYGRSRAELETAFLEYVRKL